MFRTSMTEIDDSCGVPIGDDIPRSDVIMNNVRQMNPTKPNKNVLAGNLNCQSMIDYHSRDKPLNDG